MIDLVELVYMLLVTLLVLAVFLPMAIVVGYASAFVAYTLLKLLSRVVDRCKRNE